MPENGLAFELHYIIERWEHRTTACTGWSSASRSTPPVKLTLASKKAMPNEMIPYIEMCRHEGVSLQRGMNFEIGQNHSVILMSVRSNTPYADRFVIKG